MEKTINLTSLPEKSHISWFAKLDVVAPVGIKLYGDKRTYWDVEIPEGNWPLPVAYGSESNMDTNLKITISTNGTVLDTSMTFSDILSDDGVIQGRNFIICVKLQNDFNDLCIQVSAWKSKSKTINELDFIKNLFYQYLSLKNKYHINYISDPYVGQLCKSYDTKGSQTVQEWFESEYKSVRDELQKYKLILTTLMKHEHVFANTPLTHYYWADMVFVTGKKLWNEPKITMQSNPFQYIRGMIMTVEEKKNYQNSLEQLKNVAFFETELILAASHGNKEASLEMKSTRALNFRNVGIKVKTENETAETKMIKNSVLYAGNKKAKILILLELSINSDKLDMLKHELTENGKTLQLVIGGSYYKDIPSSKAYYNRAPILYKKENVWDIFHTYDKKIPFSTASSETTFDLAVEDINLPNSVMVLPGKDIIMGVAICRDVMDLTDVHNPIHKYCDFVDLMLVISDNAGDSNMFVGTAECLARWHNCATLYTNSVAESLRNNKEDDKLEVSFGIYPRKGGPSSTSVAGVISYIKNPFVQAPAKDTPKRIRILYSSSIKYEALNEEEISSNCKIYKMKEKC